MKQNLRLLIPVFIVFMIVNGCNQKDASENPMPQESLSAAEVQELKQWAEKGDAEAQTYLGWMYAKGRGVKQDDVEAVKWFRKATDQGHAEAQYNLGWMYAKGEGVKQDDVEAVKWYRKAADQGVATAQKNLGTMYAKGKGVIEDYVEAYKWALITGRNGEDVEQIKIGLQFILTPDQISKAQELAKNFVGQN